ncbi:MAG: hypothetical protein RhofKO_06950 [Rhodothermales bacterium]
MRGRVSAWERGRVVRLLVSLSLFLVVGALEVTAQSLVEEYKARRMQQMMAAYMAEHPAFLPPAPLDAVPLSPEAVELLGERIAPEAEPLTDAVVLDTLPPPFVTSVELIPRLKRFQYTALFDTTEWAYLGSNDLTMLDTMQTRALRPRFEAIHGPPTITVIELSPERLEAESGPIQFEYWFLLNGEIPLLVFDPSGPFGRGVVVATDHRYRDELRRIREEVLLPVARSTQQAASVDYYYDPRRPTWYRTGFDGRRYFNTPIRKPALERGRPWIE